MNSEEFDRIEKKTPEQMLKYDLENEFGFSAIVARALLNKIALYNSSNNSSNLPVGVVFYWAASSKEPAGRPIEEMKLIQTKLTLNETTDISVLRKSGMQALREVKIARITEEAQNQDTYLTQEDIAVLLCSSVRTIRRDIERKTKHTTSSIERYIQDFTRVVIMEKRNKYFEYLFQTSAVSSTVSWAASNPKFCSKVTSISGNIST